MRKLPFLLLLALSGCLQLPDTSASKQTVQKGPPPQIDPKLPNQVAAAAPRPVSAQDQVRKSPPAAPKKSNAQPVLTPDDVNENNSIEAVERLAQEIENDLNDRTAPAAAVTATSNAGRPK
jgi:hypothetical protein